MTKAQPTSRRANAIWLALALVAVLGAAFPLFAWFGVSRHGIPGFYSALVAFAVCCTAGVMAIIVSGLFDSPQLAIAGVMASMLFRMGLPMGAIVLAQTTTHPLNGAGLAGSIMVYYLLMLVVEAPLTVLLVRRDPTPTGSN